MNGARVASVRKIWDRGAHNAFTDLVRFRGRWLCVFREGGTHRSEDGAVRVLASGDGESWESIALLRSEGDLRDPKIVVAPGAEQKEGCLMLTAARVVRVPPSPLQTYCWSSADGSAWSDPAAIGDPGFWLWRIAWHGGTAYSVGYENNRVRLYASPDARRFDAVVPTLLGGTYANETAFAFLSDDTMLCLLRRDPDPALLGRARPPYRDWSWKALGRRIGGPAMIRLPDGRLIAVVRLYDSTVRTSVCAVDADAGAIDELAALPSGGDTSYAGLVWHQGVLWASYYSSHEGRASIYVARIAL